MVIRLHLPQKLMRTLQRAVIEFDLLAPDDRVLLGLSGGKDSLFLLYALTVLVRCLPFSVEMSALTVDLGFREIVANDWSSLQAFCRELGIDHQVKREELASQILHHPTQNPCAQCAYFRRALIHNYAREHGFNKVALAHHYDDVVETFLMSILYSGQLTTFLPKTYLDRTGVTVIRPLVYLREKEIKGFMQKLGVVPLPSLCNLAGATKRAEIKTLIKELQRRDKNVFAHLASVLRQGTREQRWPPKLSKAEIIFKGRQFWGKKTDK